MPLVRREVSPHTAISVLKTHQPVHAHISRRLIHSFRFEDTSASPRSHLQAACPQFSFVRHSGSPRSHLQAACPLGGDRPPHLHISEAVPAPMFRRSCSQLLFRRDRCPLTSPRGLVQSLRSEEAAATTQDSGQIPLASPCGLVQVSVRSKNRALYPLPTLPCTLQAFLALTLSSFVRSCSAKS